jgi:hypothetical protein
MLKMEQDGEGRGVVTLLSQRKIKQRSEEITERVELRGNKLQLTSELISLQ